MHVSVGLAANTTRGAPLLCAGPRLGYPSIVLSKFNVRWWQIADINSDAKRVCSWEVKRTSLVRRVLSANDLSGLRLHSSGQR